jgi:hypothetical protein
VRLEAVAAVSHVVSGQAFDPGQDRIAADLVAVFDMCAVGKRPEATVVDADRPTEPGRRPVDRFLRTVTPHSATSRDVNLADRGRETANRGLGEAKHIADKHRINRR